MALMLDLISFPPSQGSSDESIILIFLLTQSWSPIFCEPPKNPHPWLVLVTH